MRIVRVESCELFGLNRGLQPCAAAHFFCPGRPGTGKNPYNCSYTGVLALQPSS